MSHGPALDLLVQGFLIAPGGIRAWTPARGVSPNSLSRDMCRFASLTAQGVDADSAFGTLRAGGSFLVRLSAFHVTPESRRHQEKEGMKRGENAHPNEGVWFHWNVPAKTKLRNNVKKKKLLVSCHRLPVPFARWPDPRAAETRGDSSMEHVFHHPSAQSSPWAFCFPSAQDLYEGLQRLATVVGLTNSKQAVPKAGPRALQAGTHLSSHIQPLPLVQMCFFSPGDRCCLGKNKAWSRMLPFASSATAASAWAALGGSVPPQVCARS